MSQAPAQREEPSMEDILSSIRKIIQSNDDSGEDASAPTEVVSEPLVEEVVAREPVEEAPVEATPLEPAPEIKVEPIRQQTPAVPEQSTVSDQGELTSAPERAREVVRSKILETVASEDATGAQTSVNSALISAGPKAKVAASFAQLNEAITASSSQSLEEMANDLLKPMLQEWLDNNLPGLVEKLVREEIERVARGGQES